ncbi:hypothetical protein FRB95_006377 [Tulasnella sp. JGI-2019a]|nr:hypothetical protein FRB93_001992 [Tulasnella sp. JGI-2019a]KAG9028516.1 hypothetical protein FRB95_006377 [Tulasnella sp. JGI-2019a]
MAPAPTSYLAQTASVLHGPKDLRLESRSTQPPQVGQAQVQIIATGLCGSDLHYYTHGRNGDFVLRSPLILGHEASGIITALGPSTAHSGLRVGQRVALEVGIACKQCRYCLDHGNGADSTNGPRYNLCENMRFCSSAKTFPHLDGTLQGRMNHPVELLHPVPASCSYEMAALAEPLAVVLHASRRTNFTATPNPKVCVIGSGAVGLLACSLSIALGASAVVAIDIDDAKLKFARKVVGVTDTWQVPRGSGPPPTDKDDAVKRSREMAEMALEDLGMPRGDGFDIVFECTGVESCIQMAIFMARPGSRVALVGMGTPIGYIPLSSSALREVDLIGVFRYANCYPEALSLLGSGKLPGVEKMVTQRFPIEDTERAFETLRRGRGDNGELVVKVMVDVTSPQPASLIQNGRATVVPPELA